MSDNTNVVQLREFDTFDEASAKAALEAQATGSVIIPGVLYQQADRKMITTGMSFTKLVQAVQIDSVRKGDDPSTKRNRPLMTDHVRTIADYLRETDNYILPPITLNVGSELICFTTNAKSPTKSVLLLLPDGVTFYVTDGQHRIEGIREVLNRGERPELRQHAVAVNLVFETNIDQVHQDFADCAQTKPIPNSLLAAFNSRNPMFTLLKRVIDEVPVFHGRIDRTSKSIGTTSLNLFTLNQIRFCVAEILLGNSVYAAAQLDKYAAERLERSRKEYEDGIVWFYRTFTDFNPTWKAIAESKGAQSQVDIPEHRANYVDLTATGLQVISRVGYSIMWMNRRKGGRDDREELIMQLAMLDFKRNAEIWQGNIIEGGNLKTNNMPVKKAVEAVKRAIGIEDSVDSDSEIK
ncbi:MAG: DNA sulfur modification protein DndB [Capsulimonadales bacterium]|nr:DNA sulfur modification protein DndB [Capsulimonadales bacterium]